MSVKQKNWILLTILSSVLLCSTNGLFAQDCKNMAYLHQNQFDPKPIELRQVQGTAIDQNGTALGQLRVGIFKAPELTLVRYDQSDGNGFFSLDTNGLPDGEYRLVGELIGFCPANAIINIKSHSTHSKPLVIHMNLPGVDPCSYVKRAKK
jgi:hypothetical protein